MTYPWDPKIITATGRIGSEFDNCIILIGMGEYIPEELVMTDTTYILRIDPKIEARPDTRNECRLKTDWGDVLRLPDKSMQTRDNQKIVDIRALTCTWVGTKADFPTFFDLMVAASQHENTSRYLIVDNGKIVGNNCDYHPMCGKLPARLDTYPDDVKLRYISIVVQLVAIHKSMKLLKYCDPTPLVRKNMYSMFSVDMSAIILLISYFGLEMSGDGTVQEKVDSYADYRRMIFVHADDVIKSYMAEMGTETYEDLFYAMAKMIPEEDK
jgi:hypothetical protein